MKALLKFRKSQLLAFFLALSLCLPLCVSKAHAFTVGRDDGTWLFPLSSNYYHSFSDWAGCPGMDRCPICGESHRNVNGVNWGESDPRPGYNHSGQGGHNGIDIAAPAGASVLAAAPGTVRVSTTRGGARGYYIVIEHPIDGTDYSYYSYYQHLSRLSVSVGQDVNAGATIGAVGSTGGNYGAHLHFGIVMGQKGTNIASRLFTIESKGWILTDGYREGRILNNPSAQSTAPRGQSAVVPPLNYHKGSTTYTFDASHVSIGEGTPVTKPTDFTVSTDRSTYTLGSTVTITPSAKDATGYAISIWRGDFGTGTRVYADFNVHGSIAYRPTAAGKYTIRADAINGAGYISTNHTFQVNSSSTLPTNFTLTSDKTTYTLGEAVTITPSAQNATHYAISVWRGRFGTGERVYVNFNLPGRITYRPTQAGMYTIRADAKNSAGYISKEITFNVESQSAPSSQLRIDPTAYPTGSLKRGSYYSLRGTISSNYTLSWVKGEVLDANGQAVCSKTQYPGSTSYSLLNSGIDYAMTFNTLAVGNYTLRYSAADSSGNSTSWTSPSFAVQSSLAIGAGRYTPGTLRRGSYYSINGTITSDVNITRVTVGIYRSNGEATEYVRTAYPNSRSYNIVNQDYYMMFNRLAVGSYYFRVTASDASGTEKTLVDNAFTAQ